MDELRYLIALTAIRGVGAAIARLLIEAFGSAEAIFRAPTDALLAIPRIGTTLASAVRNAAFLDRADRELRFIADHHIQAIPYDHPLYPRRLAECPDAPVLLYMLGQPVANHRHTVGIVGIRQCTQYGRNITQQVVHELHESIPDLVIVSGLALGIDITAHRAALECGAPTIAVVAHGLDRIYPSQHRDDARHILEQGGCIITEYMTGTSPERGNFLARNRIIAGLSDAVIVAESKDKGGSLVTASIALDYERDVFAFPGRVGDNRSEGCNRLIRLNRAGLITCAHDLIEAMRWSPAVQHGAVQQSIPFVEDNLTPAQRLITDTLRDKGDLRLSQLADATGLDKPTLAEALLDLEMEGHICNCPGGIYQLR